MKQLQKMREESYNNKKNDNKIIIENIIIQLKNSNLDQRRLNRIYLFIIATIRKTVDDNKS